MNEPEHKQELIEINYYTDPLCCWSWAMEPQWRRLRFEYSGKIKWRYRMGGMLPGWNVYNDPMNSVTRPLQMGPVWMEAKYISGMPMDDKVWVQDPPSSSYPACIAVKCAGLQSPEAEELYLRGVREAVMLNGKNISRPEVLKEVAEIIEETDSFDKNQFLQDLEADGGEEPFRQDLEKSRYHQIGRYPTFTIQKPGEDGVIITGYRPYDILLEAIKQVSPEITPTNNIKSIEEYKSFWGSITERELKEIEEVEIPG